MLAAALVIIAIATLTSIAAFQPESEVGRWAAISTIWIVIPVMFAELIILIIFLALVYGMARLLQLIPPYSDQAQKFIWRMEGYIKRGTEAIVSPVIATDGIFATIKRLFGIRK